MSGGSLMAMLPDGLREFSDSPIFGKNWTKFFSNHAGIGLTGLGGLACAEIGNVCG
jgi:hypothetical protein